MNLFRSLALLLLLYPSVVLSGSLVIPADVSVAMSAEPSVGLVPGQPIRFTISVTNHGPVPVTSLFVSSFPFTNEFDLATASAECQSLGLVVVDLEFSFFYYYNWRLTLGGALEVGETRNCFLTLPLSTSAPAVWTFGFAIPDFVTDLDPSNNSASVTLRRAVPAEEATPIPMLSSHALILLALLMAAIGVRAVVPMIRRPNN